MSHTAGIPWGPCYRIAFRFSDLTGGPRRYGTALSHAAQTQRSSEDVSVQTDRLQGVVVISVELYCDEMPAAIDRSMTVVFQLIRAAGLGQPGCLWLIASEVTA